MAARLIFVCIAMCFCRGRKWIEGETLPLSASEVEAYEKLSKEEKEKHYLKHFKKQIDKATGNPGLDLEALQYKKRAEEEERIKREEAIAKNAVGHGPVPPLTDEELEAKKEAEALKLAEGSEGSEGDVDLLS